MLVFSKRKKAQDTGELVIRPPSHHTKPCPRDIERRQVTDRKEPGPLPKRIFPSATGPSIWVARASGFGCEPCFPFMPPSPCFPSSLSSTRQPNQCIRPSIPGDPPGVCRVGCIPGPVLFCCVGSRQADGVRLVVRQPSPPGRAYDG